MQKDNSIRNFEDEQFPGLCKNEVFNLNISYKDFNVGDQLVTKGIGKFIVVEAPHKKYYNKLLEFLSLRVYKAPYQYKVKPI